MICVAWLKCVNELAERGNEPPAPSMEMAPDEIQDRFKEAFCKHILPQAGIE